MYILNKTTKGERKMKKILLTILVIMVMVIGMTGCETRQANMVSYNLSLEADNFNVVRQLTVINCIQGDTIFQMTGKMSIETDRVAGQLEVTVEDENGNYQKHFIRLSDNVTYVVEQLKFKNVENYKYVINFNPKMWLPVTVQTVD